MGLRIIACFYYHRCMLHVLVAACATSCHAMGGNTPGNRSRGSRRDGERRQNPSTTGSQCSITPSRLKMRIKPGDRYAVSAPAFYPAGKQEKSAVSEENFTVTKR